MLSLLLLTVLVAPPDDPPNPTPRPAAMVLDIKGKVEIRPVEGKSKAAEVGDLLYSDEVLAVPADGSATVSILGAGARETIKPGSESRIGPKGCMPPGSILVRKEQPKAVASTMKNLKATPGDGRKAGVGFRSGQGRPQATTPISGATVADDRPDFAWPLAEKVETYRLKLHSGAGRELWKVEVKEPYVAFPAGKDPLQPGYLYHWEVTDQDFHKIASGEFTMATASESGQFDELKELARSGDRADVHSAAMTYRRLAAYAEVIATYERLVGEAPDEPSYRKALADIYTISGRTVEAK